MVITPASLRLWCDLSAGVNVLASLRVRVQASAMVGVRVSVSVNASMSTSMSVSVRVVVRMGVCACACGWPIASRYTIPRAFCGTQHTWISSPFHFARRQQLYSVKHLQPCQRPRRYQQRLLHMHERGHEHVHRVCAPHLCPGCVLSVSVCA